MTEARRGLMVISGRDAYGSLVSVRAAKLLFSTLEGCA